MIYFTAHTFKCVCQCRRAMFRVLGMYNFALMMPKKLRVEPTFLTIFSFIYLTKHVRLFIYSEDQSKYALRTYVYFSLSANTLMCTKSF